MAPLDDDDEMNCGHEEIRSDCDLCYRRMLLEDGAKELEQLRARCLAAELLVKEAGDAWTLHLSEGGCESTVLDDTEAKLVKMTDRCLAAEARAEHVQRDFDRLNASEQALRAAAGHLIHAVETSEYYTRDSFVTEHIEKVIALLPPAQGEETKT